MKDLILENPYIPHCPTDKQVEFLLNFDLEALYGGAAGGGKSDAVLMGALMFVETPGYAALLLRRTYKDLSLPKALMDRAAEWLGPTDAVWHDTEKTWEFPSGATLTFGYLASEKDKYQYQSAEFQYIGFDELTQFTESQYTYLFSRLRKLEGVKVPLRMRSASNPGGIGHEWVKQHFITENRTFIPARLEDNPHIDRVEYEKSLEQLDPVTRAQLRWGDWDILPGGNKFKREWFEIVEDAPRNMRRVRFWDIAATEPKEGEDPDWTVGVLMGVKFPFFYILDVQRFRENPGVTEDRIVQTAIMDGREVAVRMEQEPGASGKTLIHHFAMKLMGFDFIGKPATGSKEVRANPVSAAAYNGYIKLLRGPWISDYFNEICPFPYGSHDDQVDGTSGAFEELTAEPEEEVVVYEEQETISPY